MKLRTENGYVIIYNRNYKKFQVCRGNKVLEEFKDVEDAICWAEEN